MDKELDRLEHLRLGIQYINQNKSPAYISQYEEDIDIIETALEALEIIKKYKNHIAIGVLLNELPKEEYETLKEILK